MRAEKPVAGQGREIGSRRVIVRSWLTISTIAGPSTSSYDISPERGQKDDNGAVQRWNNAKPI